LKILVVSQYFWPESFRINDVVRTLVEKGVQVDVLTGKPNYPSGNIFAGFRATGCTEQIWAGARIYRVPLFPRGQKSSWRLALNYLSFVLSGLLFGPWLLRKRTYDVVFVYGLSPILLAIPAIFLAWLKKRPLVLWVQDLWPDSLAATGYVRNVRLLKGVEWIVRWIYSRTDLLLVQSHAFVDAVRQLAPNKPIAYYPNSVDSIFAKAPDAHMPSLNIPPLESGFPVVFAGNIGTAQAVEVIVEAAALLQSNSVIQFVVFGQGSRWEWMQNQIVVRGLKNLHLLGQYPVKTMPSVMQKAGALLVTLADEPIFALTIPNKVQAYLASGRPIVACLNGEGARLIEESQAGLSVPAQNAPALAATILKLSQLPESERIRMGKNGRDFYNRHFEHDKLVDQLLVHLHHYADSAKDLP
jgi:glycosyltransferase involved in cell wall biosynthesis